MLCWLIPSTLWIYFGQNVEKPRHFLLVVPLFIILLIRGIRKAKRWIYPWIITAVMVFIVVSNTLLGWVTLKEYHEVTPPVRQLAYYIESNFAIDKTVVITWEESRVIEMIRPKIQTEMLHSWDVFVDTIHRYSSYDHILVTDKVLSGFGEDRFKLNPYLVRIKEFKGNPRIDPTYHRIILYELKVGSSTIKGGMN
jgi:hypothetical protein